MEHDRRRFVAFNIGGQALGNAAHGRVRAIIGIAGQEGVIGISGEGRGLFRLLDDVLPRAVHQAVRLIQAVHEGGFGFLGQLFQLGKRLFHIFARGIERPFLKRHLNGALLAEQPENRLGQLAHDNRQGLGQHAQGEPFKGMLEPSGELVAVLAGGKGFGDDIPERVVFLDHGRDVFCLAVLGEEVGKGPLCRTPREGQGFSGPLQELEALEGQAASHKSCEKAGNVGGEFPGTCLRLAEQVMEPVVIFACCELFNEVDGFPCGVAYAITNTFNPIPYHAQNPHIII